MKITNLSFVLALLALKTGGCMIYQGDDKTNNLCYKFVDGQLQSFYPAPTDVTGKERPIAAPNANPGSPTWNQMLEANWTVEVLQVPESLANESIEGLELKTIQADNAQAIEKFKLDFLNAIHDVAKAEKLPELALNTVVEAPAPKASKAKGKATSEAAPVAEAPSEPAAAEPVVETTQADPTIEAPAPEPVVENTDQSTSQAEEAPAADA